jgi:hypothetical protein
MNPIFSVEKFVVYHRNVIISMTIFVITKQLSKNKGEIC